MILEVFNTDGGNLEHTISPEVSFMGEVKPLQSGCTVNEISELFLLAGIKFSGMDVKQRSKRIGQAQTSTVWKYEPEYDLVAAGVKIEQPAGKAYGSWISRVATGSWGYGDRVPGYMLAHTVSSVNCRVLQGRSASPPRSVRLV